MDNPMLIGFAAALDRVYAALNPDPFEALNGKAVLRADAVDDVRVVDPLLGPAAFQTPPAASGESIDVIV